MKTLLFITFSLLTFTVLGQKKAIKPVKEIPQLSIYNLNGDASNLKTISSGKVTFIDFWFIPCGPCFLEMNMLHKLYAKYKDNPNINFLTITLTDTAFVRPLIENRNSDSNETYDYFKSLANLDTFNLPVYFIKGVTLKQKSFIKAGTVYSGKGQGKTKSNTETPGNVFGFSAYPTIFIFDKKGNTIYNKTGFTKEGEMQQAKNIETIINSKL